MIILILSLFMTLSAILFIRNLNREQYFTDLLKQADTSLNTHNYPKASTLLKLSLTHAASKKQYLRILKRAFLLAEKMNDMTVLKEIALHAALEKNRDEELVFIAARVYMKAGDTGKTLELLEKPAKTERLLSLKVEALLQRGETEALVSYYTPSQPFRFLHLLSTDDPLFYEDAAHILKDKRLFLDTSLLYALKRNNKEALRIISSYEEDPLFQAPGVFIAYDAGEYKKARQFITIILSKNGADNALLYCLYGDIEMHYSEYDKAVSLFNKAITYNPLVSETPYLNISYIYQQRGDLQSALEWLKKGSRNFPQNKNIVLEASRFFIGLNDRETAFSIIYPYKGRDYMIDLLLLYLNQENMHPSRYRTGLWDLFNAHPGNEFLCQFLVLYLLGREDINGVESALTLFDIQRGIGGKKSEYLSWVPYYKGICKVLSGDYQKSLDFFASSLAIEDNPYVLFHRALVHIESGNRKAARDDLFTSKEIIMEEGKNKRFLSLVTATLGKVFILLGEYDKAWDQLTLAGEIDPENYQVLTLVKELEELQQ